MQTSERLKWFIKIRDIFVNPFLSIWCIKRFRRSLLKACKSIWIFCEAAGILGWEDGSPQIEIPPSNIHIPKHQHPAFKTPTIQHPYSKISTCKFHNMLLFVANVLNLSEPKFHITRGISNGHNYTV